MTKKKSVQESEFLEKIAAMPDPYRKMGERLHGIVTKNAPQMTPRTWYGMPAYETDGTTICFFRHDADYLTFGFTEKADLKPDEDADHQLIPSSWFITEIDDATAEELARIIRNAVN